MIPLKPICLMNWAAIAASSGLSTTYALAVMPACGGQERTFTPVNIASGVDSASKYAWTIQSSASSRGRYSCRITPGDGPQPRASSSSSRGPPMRVVPCTAGCRRRSNASRFFATTGNDAADAYFSISSYEAGKSVAGAGTPCSVHSSCSPCLLASRRGSAGSTGGKRKGPARASACSAISTAASSSVGTSTVGRPIRRPMRSRPATSSSARSVPVVGQTKPALR